MAVIAPFTFTRTPSGTIIVPFTFPRSQLDSQWYCHCSLYYGSPTPVLICQ